MPDITVMPMCLESRRRPCVSPMNIVVVVTRYFGGTLLGTGGLVRAYTKAAQAGIAASDVRTMRYGYEMTIVTDYNGIGKVQYILGQRGIAIEEADYAEQVSVRVKGPYEEKEVQENGRTIYLDCCQKLQPTVRVLLN